MNSEIPEIKPSSSTSFNNSLYLSFHESIYGKIDAIESFDAEPNWQTFKDEYGECVKNLTEKNKVSRVNTETPELKDADAERGRIGSLLFFVVSNGLQSKNAEILKASQDVDAAIRPYKGFQNEAYLRETITIKGLLVDIRKKELTASVTKLGLTSTIDALEAANNKFEKLSKQRTDKKSALSLEIPMKELRNRMDKMYMNLCHLLYSIAFLANSESDDYRESITLINDINGIIHEHKTTHNMSMGQKNKKFDLRSEDDGEAYAKEISSDTPENP